MSYSKATYMSGSFRFVLPNEPLQEGDLARSLIDIPAWLGSTDDNNWNRVAPYNAQEPHNILCAWIGKSLTDLHYAAGGAAGPYQHIYEVIRNIED